jgi:hypothetical protein
LHDAPCSNCIRTPTTEFGVAFWELLEACPDQKLLCWENDVLDVGLTKVEADCNWMPHRLGGPTRTPKIPCVFFTKLYDF